MPEVQLKLPYGYMIGRKWIQLAHNDEAFAYHVSFGNGEEKVFNRSTWTFYDIPVGAQYIEYKAIGGVFNGVKYLDSEPRKFDIPYWHYPVMYLGKEYKVVDLIKEKLKLSEITSFRFGSLEEENGESAIRGTCFYKGVGGYLLIEGKDADGVQKKIFWRSSGVTSLGELFDSVPELYYNNVLSVEEVNDTNRFELEDFKYYMQNEIIPHMQKNYPKYAEFFKTCDMNDYEISNYVGFGVYCKRYDHERQQVSVDLKNAEGRALHLELSMDMEDGIVFNWQYVREHKMLFSQVNEVDHRVSEKLHSYDIYPTSYFDGEGCKAIIPNDEFNQKIIDTEIDSLTKIYPSLNFYFEGEVKDELWEKYLSDLYCYPMPHADEIREQLREEKKANASSASIADDSTRSVADDLMSKFTAEDGGFDYPAYQEYLMSLYEEEDKKLEHKKEQVILYDEKDLF